NNTAIAATQKPWVWLVNPDAFVKTDCLQTLLGEVSENNNVKAFSAELVSANDHAQLDGQGDCYHISGLVWRRKHGQERSGRQSTLPMFSPCAASALYSREAVLEVGGFDEDYFCYIEDVDLGFRLRLAGYDCLHVKDAITYHVGSAITERDSDFSIYHGHRNLVWTYFKNMPTAKLWQCLPQHLLMNLVSIVYYSLKGRPGVILKAKWHAIKGLHSHIQKRKKPAQGTQSVVNFMAGGWLTPYRGRHD
ncbi:MAG: glycosyltransferase family 2 protein, partial [Arenicellales bacterium]